MQQVRLTVIWGGLKDLGLGDDSGIEGWLNDLGLRHDSSSEDSWLLKSLRLTEDWLSGLVDWLRDWLGGLVDGLRDWLGGLVDLTSESRVEHRLSRTNHLRLGHDSDCGTKRKSCRRKGRTRKEPTRELWSSNRQPKLIGGNRGKRSRRSLNHDVTAGANGGSAIHFGRARGIWVQTGGSTE